MTLIDFGSARSWISIRSPSLVKSPVLWVFGDPALDRFSPVNLSLNRVEQAKASGMPYDILQIDNVGHTLELEGDRDIQTLVQVRVPLIWKMFRWLDGHVSSTPEIGP